MDGNRFDDLTRGLASGITRRSVLKRSLAAVAAITGIGQVADSSAARRPTPTPKPPSCPGRQVWRNGACVCPSGEQCGAECCDSGTVCCDNACCAGTCYGEERCCPAGQLVCDGVCLDPGLCCVDSDCGPGYACQGNQCICVPTTSCASQGIECGPATDDCGNPLSCGECTSPQTCGGGGTSGVCGCTTQMTCEGRCGSVPTECGTVLECGSACGACQVCSAENTCVPAAFGADCSFGCTGAQCVEGQCYEEYTVPCPPFDADPCQTYACSPSPQGPLCLGTPANEGAACDPQTYCQTGVCTNGQCVGTPIVCPVCHTCTTTTCEPITGESCGDGFQCLDGGCYAFPGGNDIVSETLSFNICSALKCEDACCPGESGSACCSSMDDCFMEGGAGEAFRAFCCLPENKCGSQCCGAGEVCAGGTECRPGNQVCANDAFCGSVCCGGGGFGTGACCSDTQQCHNGQCVEVSAGACNGDGDCLAGSTCVGVVIADTPNGPQVVRQGFCCLPEYTTGGSGGPLCCAPGTYPTGQINSPCCQWASRNCPNCTCSTISVRGWRR
jgi:hypothetical protein